MFNLNLQVYVLGPSSCLLLLLHHPVYWKVEHQIQLLCCYWGASCTCKHEQWKYIANNSEGT